MSKRFECNILGQELSLISDADDERVENVVRYVSDKIAEAGGSAGGNSLTAAILAALNIADEYLQIVEKDENTYCNLESKAEQLIRFINDSR